MNPDRAREPSGDGGAGRGPEGVPVTGPVRLAVVDAYEIVVAGVTSMLAPFDDRVKVIGVDDGPPSAEAVDVVLYDTVADLERAADGDPGRARLAVFSWDLDATRVRHALALGAAGYLSKGLGALELVAAVERIHAGEVVTAGTEEPCRERATRQWPGREAGLSARESETVALITQGLSNREIAELSFLSINSVKTYIRSAYRKMGVERRSQAVLWGLRHGFDPELGRSTDGDDHDDLTRRPPAGQPSDERAEPLPDHS